MHRILLTLLALTVLSLSAARADSPRPELVLGVGHAELVEAVAGSADGRFVLTRGSEGTVKVWDNETRRVLGTVPAMAGKLTAMSWNPDARHFATGGLDHVVRVWDVTTMRQAVEASVGANPIKSVAYSPDGRALAIANGEMKFHVWQPGGSEMVDSADVPTTAGAIAWTPSGICCSGLVDGRIHLFDAQTLQEKAIIGNAAATRWAVSGDGKRLALATAERRIEVYSLEGTLVSSFIGDPKGIQAVALSPRGDRVAASSLLGASLTEWNVDTRAQVGRVDGKFGIFSLAWSADGRTLLVDARTNLEAWNPDTLRSLATFSYWIVPTSCLALNAREGVLAVGTHYGARIWDLSSGLVRTSLVGNYAAAPNSNVRDARFSHELPLYFINAASFSSDGTRLMTCGAGLAVWNTQDWKARTDLRPDQAPYASCGVMSPDGGGMATGGLDGAITLWDAQAGRIRATLKGHSGSLCTVRYSPDGKTLASLAMGDPNLRLWDPATATERAVLAGGFTDAWWLAFHPRLHQLAVAQSTELQIWDYDGRKLLRTIKPATLTLGPVAYSPNGQILATGGFASGEVLTFDAATGAQLGVMRAGSGVNDLLFTADGRLLLVALKDGSVQIFDVNGAELLATAVDIGGGRDYVVVTPQGFFDASPRGAALLSWRFGEHTLALEQFYNEFYHPGLLADIMKYRKSVVKILQDRQDPRAALIIAERNRSLPQVAIEAPRTSALRMLPVRVKVSSPSDGGIRDVRLFRNDTLVARWAGPQVAGYLTATVPLVAGNNRLTAYAFNRDNVKSKDATFMVAASPKVAHAATAWVLAIGVNKYSDSRFNLQYAVADAQTAASALKSNLPFNATAMNVQLLTDDKATRANILAAIKALATRAQPEDTVIVTWSGHGILLGDRFYLVPTDIGPKVDNDEELARHGISDLDLEQLFLPVQAGHIALVLDACHSGQALASDDWRRGPMNARGLIQLAWEKGMEVLTASQSQQAALEAWKVGDKTIGHGLLTYTLMEEGFVLAPRVNGGVSAHDWLDYAALRVPELLGRSGGGERAIKLGGSAPQASSAVQIPRVFHRREGGGDWMISGKKQ